MPDNLINAIEEFGLCLGYAYQIIDDLLDFLGDSNQLGKPIGSDLAEGNITLPIIYALKDNTCRQSLFSLLNKDDHSPQDLDEIIKILIASGSIQECLRTARGFIAKGLACLALMPVCAAIKDLEDIAAFVLKSFEHKAVNYHEAYHGWMAQ
jgi:heptaprenyl diphosphate synthase